MEKCVFPEDVMVSILTRLPVKSILRFKSVCKPWCKLFAKPWFVKLHHAQISENPENDAVVIYSLSGDDDEHTMSLFKTESDEEKPITLDHPYPDILFKMDFVGSYNGVVCMGCPPLGQCIVLWNPATRLFKMVRLSKVPEQMVSLGFGYDDEGDDFKVVRIVHLKNKGNKMGVGVEVEVEVYSSISDSWRTMKLGFQFSVLFTRNDAVVNGNPYWVAMVDEKVKDRRDRGEVVVCLDVKKMVFKVVPLWSLNTRGGQVVLVDWKDSLGALVCAKKGEMVESFDVWVFDDGIWGKKHTFRPIDLKVVRSLQCSKNGKILGMYPDGKLIVYDPETGSVKEIVIDGARKFWFQIYGYAESLSCIKGMKKVVVKIKEGDVGDGDGDVDDSEAGVYVQGVLVQHLYGGKVVVTMYS